MATQKITPCLWFDNQAEDAAKYYTKIFSNGPHSTMAKVEPASHYDESSAEVSGQEKGTVMVVPFEIEGQHFLALNGGPQFKFTEAVSFTIDCEDQEEVDYFWDNLTADGGEESMCGWLKDKFGLSWQVVPRQLNILMSDGDQEKSGRVMQAMLQMKKLDVSKLQAAHDGK